jgi:hypothetical protein
VRKPAEKGAKADLVRVRSMLFEFFREIAWLAAGSAEQCL